MYQGFEVQCVRKLQGPQSFREKREELESRHSIEIEK